MNLIITKFEIEPDPIKRLKNHCKARFTARIQDASEVEAKFQMRLFAPANTTVVFIEGGNTTDRIFFDENIGATAKEYTRDIMIEVKNPQKDIGPITFTIRSENPVVSNEERDSILYEHKGTQVNSEGLSVKDTETIRTISPAKKSPAKKSPVKKSPVKKSPVKKSPVKKSPVKKSSAKKSSAKKSPAKKSPVKKSPVKKTPAKKAPAKKAPAKKAPAKKAPAKKAPAKKAPAKRSPARKSSAKRSPAKKRSTP